MGAILGRYRYLQLPTGSPVYRWLMILGQGLFFYHHCMVACSSLTSMYYVAIETITGTMDRDESSTIKDDQPLLTIKIVFQPFLSIIVNYLMINQALQTIYCHADVLRWEV